MKILLTFTGFHDPYSTGLIGDEQVAGPILSLIQATRIDKVILFSTPNTKNNTQKTQQAISEIHPEIILETIDLPLYDPTDYIAILSGLRKNIVEICDVEPDAELYVSVASGTPQMHACWLLLSASGELPARILHIRPPKFVTKDKPLVSEIDLTSPEFPLIRTKIGYIEAHDEQFPAINCAAIPKDLVESFLFGHKKGAFTGAINDQDGKFSLADGGTLFLDELAELPQ